jgi:quercetin dioxygenase-like cupin family protein
MNRWPANGRPHRRGLLAVTMVIGSGAMIGSSLTSGAASESPDTTIATPATSEHAAGHDTEAAGDLTFSPAPPVFPAGAEMAVIQGDPSVAGEVFTVRLRLPDGYVLPAHWHPTDEFVTVISGTFLVGLGDAFDQSALMPAMRPGDFVVAPANANHFATVRGETEVQVHAVGPFELTYVNSDDDPRNQDG